MAIGDSCRTDSDCNSNTLFDTALICVSGQCREASSGGGSSRPTPTPTTAPVQTSDCDVAAQNCPPGSVCVFQGVTQTGGVVGIGVGMGTGINFTPIYRCVPVILPTPTPVPPTPTPGPTPTPTPTPTPGPSPTPTPTPGPSPTPTPSPTPGPTPTPTVTGPRPTPTPTAVIITPTSTPQVPPTPTPTVVPWRRCIDGTLSTAPIPTDYRSANYLGVEGGICWEPTTIVSFEPDLNIALNFIYNRGTNRYPPPQVIRAFNPSYASTFLTTFQTNPEIVITPSTLTLTPRGSTTFTVGIRSELYDKLGDGDSRIKLNVDITEL